MVRVKWLCKTHRYNRCKTIRIVCSSGVVQRKYSTGDMVVWVDVNPYTLSPNNAIPCPPSYVNRLLKTAT